MGNSASLNENISKLENLDISKSISKNLTSKCSACCISLNIISFKRKKCRNCIEYYCQNCLKQFKENIFICYRCVIFISPQFSWDGLMKLKTKDLKWFLVKHHIDCTSSKEKEQLVELIMERFSSADDQQKRANHRKLLLSNMENLYDLENQTNGDNSNIPVHDRRTDRPNVLDNSPGTSTSIQPNSRLNERAQSLSPSTSSGENNTPTENDDRIPPPQYQEVDDANKLSDYSAPTNHDSATTINSNANIQDADEQSDSKIDTNKTPDRNQRVYIENISESNEIEDLSVKQLKDLLAYNKMDYKGCVEKHELITRVQRLWTDCQLSSTKFSSDRQNANSARECIICMDHVIDGVLLECGHMISCVRCGSQLAECPICRQNVVRVKRVFSAH